ncbi:hypothetical protein [Burkholderia ubonensis]|uniref:hypothetical protein n=1 Tax=Burkholderia ubonensis TaxID=101571 RepID=UPI000A80DF59|nr:hypothetical protein [Burkholderia ubonensis]
MPHATAQPIDINHSRRTAEMCANNRPMQAATNMAGRVSSVASARRHSMPSLEVNGDMGRRSAHSSSRQSFGRDVTTVSSQRPEAPAAESGATEGQDFANHAATSLEQARDYLAGLVRNQDGNLSTRLDSLSHFDRGAIDNLARTVYALHQTVGDNAANDKFEKIGDALAAFLKSAGRQGATSEDQCVANNRNYRKLCECVRDLLKMDGVAVAMFDKALDRGDRAADRVLAARLGGQADGSVRSNGMLNRHGGDAQLRMAEKATAFALNARHATNLVDMAGTALKLLDRSDQLLNSVSLARPAASNGPRSADGAGALPHGQPMPSTPPQQAAPIVINNNNHNNVNLDGLRDLVDNFSKMVGALLKRLDSSGTPPGLSGAASTSEARESDSEKVQINDDKRGERAAHQTAKRGVSSDTPVREFDGNFNSPGPNSLVEGAGAGSAVDHSDAAAQRAQPREFESAGIREGGETDADDVGRPPQDQPATGSWHRNSDGKWERFGDDTVVRLTEGFSRIDPFSSRGMAPGRGTSTVVAEKTRSEAVSDGSGPLSAERRVNNTGRLSSPSTSRESNELRQQIIADSRVSRGERTVGTRRPSADASSTVRDAAKAVIQSGMSTSKKIQTVAPPAKIVTTDGASRNSWSDSIAKDRAR